MKSGEKRLFRFCVRAFFTAGILYFCCVPVPVLILEERREAPKVFVSQSLVPSQPIITRYIHSVEKTPVEDEYYASSGMLWQWEERVRSHNAGLPFLKRSRGIFFQSPCWMHFRGGGAGYPSIFLRIGNEEFGQNQLELPKIASWDLFREFPGKPVTLRVRETSLLFAWWESLFS